jgi:hypothetical protein
MSSVRLVQEFSGLLVNRFLVVMDGLARCPVSCCKYRFFGGLLYWIETSVLIWEFINCATISY